MADISKSDKVSSDEASLPEAHYVPDEETQELSSKQQKSSFFTILASAFGLISDGCESSCLIPFRVW